MFFFNHKRRYKTNDIISCRNYNQSFLQCFLNDISNWMICIKFKSLH